MGPCAETLPVSHQADLILVPAAVAAAENVMGRACASSPLMFLEADRFPPASKSNFADLPLALRDGGNSVRDECARRRATEEASRFNAIQHCFMAARTNVAAC
jgi:hypothetical protein